MGCLGRAGGPAAFATARPITCPRYIPATESTNAVGTVRPITNINTFNLNRYLINFAGHVVDERLFYDFALFGTSDLGITFGVVPIGLAGWKFSDAAIIGAGVTPVPGTREWIGASPWTLGVDRSMVNTFFRPGFSPGVLATGVIAEKTLHYQAGIWNAIDGGTAGVLGVGTSVDSFLYNLATVDAGLKYQGWSVNFEYYFRLLDNFKGTGSFDRTSIFDQGGMAYLSWCFVPRTYEVYARSSVVTGPFGTGQEYGGGLNAYIRRSRQARLTLEALHMNRNPANNILYPYRAGFTGTAIQTQFVVAF